MSGASALTGARAGGGLPLGDVGVGVVVRKTAMVALVTALALGGCQTLAKYSYTAGPGQELMVRQGRDAVVSRQRHSTVILATTSRTSAPGVRPEFVAMIQNTSNQPITFRYGEITAVNAVTDQPLKVFSLDDLQTEARTAAIVGAILVGAAGAAAGAAAARNAGTSYGSGSINGPYGASTYTWRTYNPGVANATAAAYGVAAGAAAGGMVAAGERTVQELERNVLVDQTLMPGEWYGGFMTIASAEPENDSGSAPRRYRVTVTVGPDTHVFLATASTVRPN